MATRTAEKPQRGDPAGLPWIADLLGWGPIGVELDSVTCDGREPESAIVLHTNRGRVVIPGTAVLLSGQKLQAVLTAALHYGAPKLSGEQGRELADVLLGLASVLEIHAAEHAAIDWGNSYLWGSHAYPIELEGGDEMTRRDRWAEVQRIVRDHSSDLKMDGPHPARVLVRVSDQARLVVRPWFHAFARDLAGGRGMSEQRIASLMALAGWESFPLSRSALTIRNPANRGEKLQLRLYVVAAGWEGAE